MYISDKQLAERFAVTRHTIWRWAKCDKTFPKSYTLSPGCTRWRAEDVKKWENARLNNA